MEDADREFYYRGDGDAIIYGLGREMVAGGSPDLSASEVDEYWSLVQSTAPVSLPSYARADTFQSYRSGFRQITPEYLLSWVIQRTQRVSFTRVAGWRGRKHSPAGGRAVADLIYGTSSHYFSRDALDPNRFSRLNHSNQSWFMTSS